MTRKILLMPICALIASAALALSPGAVHAGILYDQNVIPDVIFGSGNANGSFTVFRSDNVTGPKLELGLRGKLRHNAAGAAENTFNSNGDGTYSFNAGVAPTQSFPTAEWSFEWSINTDYVDAVTRSLNDLTYELSLDTDPSAGTSFISFDPIKGINPGFGEVRWDHSMGNNSTANGQGQEFDGDESTYLTALLPNNVAQNSWKPHWFIPGFDPTLDATYDISLAAFDGTGEIGRTTIQIIVGNGGSFGAVPEPSSVAIWSLIGMSAVGFVGRRYRRRK